MGKYHILETDNGHSARVVHHVTVPTGYNAAGTPWSECVKLSTLYRRTTVIPGIDHANLVDAGNIIEVDDLYKFSDPDLTPAQQKNEIEERHLMVRDRELINLDLRLKYYEWVED